MRAVLLLALLAGCSGRAVENAQDDTGPTDAGSDGVVTLGACGAEGETGICDGRSNYFPVDQARGCVDTKAKGFDTCVCKRTSTDCLIEPDSGVVYVAGCSGPRPAGFCDCPDPLRLASFPVCP